MDPTQVAKAMAALGITGVDPTKETAAMELAQQLGADVEATPESVRAYLPDISDEDDMQSFYIPKVPKGFYTGCFARLRQLTTPKFGRRR